MVSLQAVVSLNSKPFQGKLSGLRQITMNATSAMAYAFGGVTGEIMTMTRAFGPIGGLSVIMKSVISVGAQFEKQMAAVSTVTGLVGDALDKVGTAAMDFAKTTTFTATQASDALYALGSAGVSTAEGLIDMLAPSLKLAGATQHEVKGTTEALTKTLAAFRLETDQTTRIADLFAGAVAASPANMERLSNALAYAAPVAAAFGMEAEQMVETLAAFHTVGLLGSKAGTSFGQAMMSMRDAMKKADTTIGAALKGWDPAIEGMTGGIERLEKAGIKGSQVMDEFGRRGGRAVAAQLALGSVAIRKLGDEITRLGDVERMYAVQSKTLSGQWDIFISMINAASISLFYKLRPALMDVVFALQKGLGGAILATTAAFGKLEKNIRSITGVIRDWFRSLDPAVKGIFAMVGALAALLLGLAALKIVAIAFYAKFIVGALKASTAFLSGFVVPVLAAMAVLTVALAAFSFGQVVRNVQIGSNTIGGHVDAMVEQLISDFEFLMDTLPKYMRLAMLTVKQKIIELAPEITKAFTNFLAPTVTMFGEWAENVARMINFDGVADKIKGATERMSISLQNFDAGVSLKNTRSEMEQLASEIEVVRADNVAKLNDAFDQLGREAPENINKVVTRSELMSKWMEQIGLNTEKVWEVVQAGGPAAAKVLEELKKKATSMGESMTETGEEVDKTTGLIKDLAASAQDASTKFILPRLNVLEVDRFADAIETLSGRLNGLSISIPGLADLAKISDFKLPRLHQSEIGRFIQGVTQLATGLKDIEIPDLSGLFPAGIKSFSQDAQSLAETLTAISELDFTELDLSKLQEGLELKLNLEDLDFTKLKDSGLATEETLGKLFNKVESMQGVLWA